MAADESTTVLVGERRITLTHLDKVLYPATGTTKGEVLHYVASVAEALLPLLGDRPLTRVRWPHGTAGNSFFEKNLPAGAPEWLRSVTLDSPSSRRTHERVTYPVIEDLAALTWLTNLSALELHTPQWRVDADGAPQPSDRLVIDLDPGPPAGLPECARVALLVREALAERTDAPIVPVTSGSKGMQIYTAARGLDGDDRDGDVDTRAFAERLASGLAREHPDLVVAKMTKSLRAGKVFLDWSQNTRAKTTICPYSLRGKGPAPYIAAPRTWAEIEEGRSLRQLPPDAVLERLGAQGDLMAGLH